MKEFAQLVSTVQNASQDVSGVLSRGDLANLFATPLGPTLNKRIEAMLERGVLQRAVRGVYYTPDAQLEDIALKIYPQGYLSLSTALSTHLMIGTKPTFEVSVITNQSKGKTFQTDKGTIAMSISSTFDCADTIFRQGRRYASQEQAFIDACVFYLRGKRYPFNLMADLNVDNIAPDKLKQLLSNYRNQKIKSFVWNVWEVYGRST